MLVPQCVSLSAGCPHDLGTVATSCRWQEWRWHPGSEGDPSAGIQFQDWAQGGTGVQGPPALPGANPGSMLASAPGPTPQVQLGFSQTPLSPARPRGPGPHCPGTKWDRTWHPASLLAACSLESGERCPRALGPHCGRIQANMFITGQGPWGKDKRENAVGLPG